LFDYQTQLRSLEIDRPITELGWLRADLKSLTLRSKALASLQGLPELPSLQTLVLSQTQIASLQGLPELPVLKEVILGGYSLQSLEGLPPTVAGLIFELKTRPGSA
jgi:Leucine-rich repeat (LRR) protein